MVSCVVLNLFVISRRSAVSCLDEALTEYVEQCVDEMLVPCQEDDKHVDCEGRGCILVAIRRRVALRANGDEDECPNVGQEDDDM